MVDEYADVIAFVVSEYKFDFYKDEMHKIYMETYDDEELDYLYNYYSSEMGKKIVEKIPVVTQRALELGEELGNRVIKRADEYFGIE